MENKKKYIVRREYFGAYVFDRETQLDYIFGEESAKVFKIVLNNPGQLEKQDYENLCNLGFISNGRDINFDYFENPIFGECFSAPIVVHFPYTDRCNLNCKHCFSKNGGLRRALSFGKRLEILDEFQKIGVCKIMVGGGEPFLCDDIIPFLEESVARGLVTKVFSNGLSFDDQTIESLSKIDLGGISISVDTPVRQVYEKIRGVDELPRVIGNIKKLVEKCPFPVSISATIGSYNLGHEKALLKLAAKCKAFKLKVRPVRPCGNAGKNLDVLPTADAYAGFLKKIQQAYSQNRDKYLFKLDLHWGSGKIVASKTRLDLTKTPNPYGEFGCIAGKDIAFIDTDGTVLPCGFLPAMTDAKDSILDSKLIDIWRESPNFKFIRELNANPKCYRCRYYCSCRGGCPARNIHNGLDYSDCDPWCPKDFFPILLSD